MNTENENEFLENPEDIKPGVKAAETPEERAAEQDRIFVEAVSGGGTWKGNPLNPLSLPRRLAAEKLGLTWGTMNQDETNAFVDTGYYPGISTDLVLVMWVCFVPKSEVLRAQRLPKEALEKAMAWAEKENLEPGTPEYDAAMEFMISEFVKKAKAQGRFVTEDGKTIKSKPPGN